LSSVAYPTANEGKAGKAYAEQGQGT
jgi:hypothetical protein